MVSAILILTAPVPLRFAATSRWASIPYPALRDALLPSQDAILVHLRLPGLERHSIV